MRLLHGYREVVENKQQIQFSEYCKVDGYFKNNLVDITKLPHHNTVVNKCCLFNVQTILIYSSGNRQLYFLLRKLEPN